MTVKNRMKSVIKINKKCADKVNDPQLFKMSLPIFIELMLQLLVGNIDQVMMSRYSQNAVAAIVNANQVMNLVIIFLNMVSMAAAVILSRYLGAKDDDNASRTCMLSLGFISVISTVITVIILFVNKPIFSLMKIQPEIMGEARLYLMIVGGFILIQGLYLNFAAILRTYTLMKEVMYVSVAINLLNIAGNAVLINGLFGMPVMGLAGAAISTVISKIIGLLILIWIFRNKIRLSFGAGLLRPFPSGLLGNMCKIAVPSGAECLSYQMSQLCILGIINTFGTVVTAAKGYCSILANFSYLYALALSQATQILTGYLCGQKRMNEIKKRVFSTMRVCIVICFCGTFLLFINSDLVLRIFTDNTEILQLGKKILFLEFFLEFGRSINNILTRSLIAVGDVKTPMIVGITGQWMIAFTLSYVFGKELGLGLPGVWIAMALDECIRALIYVIRFGKKRW
ncbi:MATE family efflux transporter [Robinsoniella peoriensis]|uniref:MATE family efflux transporter n=1 Tax=Robinsoniella peoriensis TaxID=180332 RepID=UPI000A4B3401|nr:MATE family efflux transporter [Robinsoniella peoriensis]